MSKKNSQTRVDEQAQDAVSTGSVETIRDILFGQQIQDYEKRFKILEQRLASDISALAKSSSKDLESFHSSINQQLDAHAAQMAEEASSRHAAIEALEAISKSDSDSLGKQIDHVEAETSKAISQTRQELLEKLEDTRQLLETRLDELTKNLSDQINLLSSDKISRGQLSGLLSQVARQLDADNT